MSKLFILIRNDIPLAYQGVQGGHAVAQWLLDNPQQTWNNNILVYLKVKDLQDLKRWMFRLDLKQIKYSQFVEPDIGDEITAIASQANDKVFEKLNLVGT